MKPTANQELVADRPTGRGTASTGGPRQFRIRPGSVLVGFTGLNVVRAGFLVVGAILATRLLPPSERGLMVLGTTIVAVGSLIAGLGVGSALRATLPGLSAGIPRRRMLASYSWCSVLAAISSGGLAVLLSVASAPFIDPGLAEPRYLFAMMVVGAGYSALSQLPDAWYAAGEFRAGSAWATIVVAAGIVGMMAGAALSRSAGSMLLAQGVGVILASCAHVVRMRRAGLFCLRAPARRELVRLASRGSRALGLTLGLVVTLRLDRYVIGAVDGTAPVAVYSLAATLSVMPGLLPSAMGQIALGEIAAGAGLPHVRRTWRAAIRYAAAAALVVGVGGWLMIVPVFGAEFAEARPLLLVLLVAEVLFAPFEVASRCLIGGGWMSAAGLLGAAGCLAAVTLYLVAVPALGMYGAALACVVLYGGMSIASCLLLRRLFAVVGPRASPVEVNP